MIAERSQGDDPPLARPSRALDGEGAPPPRFTVAWLRAFAAKIAVGVAFGACGVGLALHIRHYWPYLSDDSLISLRYAVRLATGHGLTWTDGERVEGYTNLLWVLLNTPATWLGVDPILSARVLGIAGVSGAVAAIGWSPSTGKWSVARIVAGGGLLVASAPAAVWAIGGLEPGMMIGVMGIAIVALQRLVCAEYSRNTARVAAFALAAIALLRADGALAVAVLLGATIIVGFPDRKRFATGFRLALPVGIAVAGQLAFRLVYYGEWWPNSAFVKVAFTMDRFRLGVDYVKAAADGGKVVLALACLGTALALERRPRGRLLLPWLLGVTWVSYITVLGADIFPAHRRLLPVLLALCLLIADGAEVLHVLVQDRIFVAALSLVPLGIWHVRIQNADPASDHAHKDSWEFDGLAIGELLKTAFGNKRPLFAMDAAGALAYASELPALDLLGLNDRHIGHHRTGAFGHGAPGHELGDGRYVFERQPDLVTFACGGGIHQAAFISGHELVAIPEFARRYQWIRLQAGPPRNTYGEVWVRRTGGPLGIQRESGRLGIPGYFFTGETSETRSRLTPDGVLAAHVQPGTWALVTGIEVPPGRWRAELVADGSPERLVVRCKGKTLDRLASGAALVIDVPAQVSLDVAAIAQAGAPLIVRELNLVDDRRATATYRCPVPGQPVHVAYGELQTRRARDSASLVPTNVVLPAQPLHVELPARMYPRRLDLSVDNNDQYLVQLVRSGDVVWTRLLFPPSTGGLASLSLSLPPQIATDGVDAIRIVPQGGDGLYAVGHLIPVR